MDCRLSQVIPTNDHMHTGCCCTSYDVTNERGTLVVLWSRLVLPTGSCRVQVPPVSGHFFPFPLFNLSALEFTHLYPIKWGGVSLHPSEEM